MNTLYSSELPREGEIGLPHEGKLELPRFSTKEEFIAYMHALHEEAQKKKQGSLYEKFKAGWKKHSLLRIASGVALAGGAMLSVGLGAPIVAGGLLATRAVLSGIGGYMAMDGVMDFGRSYIAREEMEVLLRKVNEVDKKEQLQPYIDAVIGKMESHHLEQSFQKALHRQKTFSRTKFITSVTAGAVLGILGGSSAVHAAEISSWIQSDALSISHVWWEASASMSAPAVPITPLESMTAQPALCPPKFDVNVIMNDILHDHPNQKCITLEQAVRRVEGLKIGIPLDHSEKLTSLNHSVSCMVHDPDGPIAQSMRNIGCLSEHQDIESAARKLSPERIKEILEKTYNIPHSWVPHDTVAHEATNFISASDSSIASSTSSIPESPNIPDTPISIVDAHITNAPAVIPVMEPQSIDLSTKILAGSSALLAISAASLFFSKRKEKTRSMPQPEQITHTPERITYAPEWITNADRITTECRSLINPESIQDTLPVDMEESKDISFIFNTVVLHRTDLKKLESIENTYSAQTFGGRYELFLQRIDNEKIKYVFKWFDGEVLGFEKEYTINIHSSSQNEDWSWVENQNRIEIHNSSELQKQFQQSIKNAYFEAFMQRELRKQLDMREVDTLEISKQDLWAIFRQCEEPLSQSGKETGGYFFQSLYGIQNKTLRLRNIHNPKPHQIESSFGDFTIRPDAIEEYYLKGIDLALADFPERERDMLLDWFCYIKETQNVGEGPVGIKDHYNWHKHPGAPEGPSSMDVLFGEGTRLDTSPFRQSVTWAIVNMTGSLPDPVPSNMLVIPKEISKRPYHYKITFWKFSKLSPTEIKRRKEIIQRVGIMRAVRAGISDEKGNPIRLQSDVTIGNEKIKSDLVPMNIRVVD